MGKTGGPSVRVLSADDSADVIAVLVDAFADYPVMRFVLGERHVDAEPLRRLVGFFTMARVLRGETMLGVDGPDGLAGVALISRPDDPVDPPGLRSLRAELWRALGPDARDRYESFGAVTAAFQTAAPHVHLNMIGVRRDLAGRGLGRALLDAVHARSAADPRSGGVSLTTEVAGNVRLYEHFGYEMIGSAEVGSAFTTWGMFRRDDA